MKELMLWWCCAWLLIVDCASADVGVFTGVGSDIQQISSEEIQLVSIDVTIVPGRGPFPFGGTIPNLDRVQYSCVFQLVNLTDERTKVQVGFPVSSQFAFGEYAKENADSTEWVLKYSFIARDDVSTYHVGFVPGERADDEKVFSMALFTWDMEFAPKEKKELRVQYTLPMSMTFAPTLLDYGKEYVHDRPWSRSLTDSALEYFGYITETGASWAGKVKRANFTVITEPFEGYLDQRGFADGDSPRTYNGHEVWPIHHCWWFRVEEPEGWKPVHLPRGNALRWSYRDYEPSEGIVLSYRLTVFPRRAKDVDKFIDVYVATRPKARRGDDNPPAPSVTRADLVSVRQVMLATYGQKPQDPAALEFAESQIWYEPRESFSMEDLTPEQQEIIKGFDRRIEAVDAAGKEEDKERDSVAPHERVPLGP